MSSAPDLDPGLDELHARWTEAFERRDVATILSLMTPDYELWPAGAAPIGGEALVVRLREAFEQWDVSSSFERQEQVVCGDLAFERGWDVLTLKAHTSGESRTHRQRVFLVSCRDTDGRWRFARGMRQPGPGGDQET